MIWTAAVVALLVVLLVAMFTVVRGGTMDRVVGLQLTNVLAVLVAIALAVVTGRAALLDVALVMAVLTLAAGLAYARFLERWL